MSGSFPFRHLPAQAYRWPSVLRQARLFHLATPDRRGSTSAPAPSSGVGVHCDPVLGPALRKASIPRNGSCGAHAGKDQVCGQQLLTRRLNRKSPVSQRRGWMPDASVPMGRRQRCGGAALPSSRPRDCAGDRDDEPCTLQSERVAWPAEGRRSGGAKNGGRSGALEEAHVCCSTRQPPGRDSALHALSGAQLSGDGMTTDDAAPRHAAVMIRPHTPRARLEPYGDTS